MESAKFRFTDEKLVSVEFDACISTAELFASSLEAGLTEYKKRYPGKRSALHMHHDLRWMPLNWDSGSQTIVAKTIDPSAWAMRIAPEILNVWSDTIKHADQLNSLLSKSSKKCITCSLNLKARSGIGLTIN